jgi:hypothetical protein
MSKVKAAFLPNTFQNSRFESLPPITVVRAVPNEVTEACEDKPGKGQAPTERVGCSAKTTTIVMIVVALTLHVYDTLTDVVYITQAEFINQTFFICALLFLTLSPALQFFLTVVSLWKVYQIHKRSGEVSLKVGSFVLKGAAAALVITLGLFDLIFLYVVMTQKSAEVFEMFDMLSKSFAFLSALFKSIPQIIVTMLNNYYTNSWEIPGIISISAGAIAAFFDAFSCLQSFGSIARLRPADLNRHQSDLSLDISVSKSEIERVIDPPTRAPLVKASSTRS